MAGCVKYCNTSTLHGLKYVGDMRISLMERTFWLVAFGGAVMCAVYFITTIYEKYERSPVIISFNPRMVTLREIPFPAITICNVNIALKARAHFIEAKGTYLHRQLLSHLCRMNNTYPPQFDNFSIDMGVEEESPKDIFEWAVVQEIIININQKCGEMFKSCKWDGKTYQCHTLINTILTDEGYCCSFNKLPGNYSLRNEVKGTLHPSYPPHLVDWNPEDGYPANISRNVYPYRSYAPGQHLGLSVVLDADLAQYYCTTTNSVGFKALLATPIEMPKVADIGWLIAPGTETRVAIGVDISDTTDSLRRIDFRKRQCFYARERHLRFYRFYTESNCRLECEANFTLLHCGCIPYYLPKDSNVFVCDQKRDSCTDQAKNLVERFSPQSEQCNCLPACFEMKYYPKSITSGKILPEFNTMPLHIRSNYSPEYFSTNMAVVHFYFPSNKFTKRTKGEIYGFSEFLSNTGGLLGLFLGFSFMSVVEIFYFVCVCSVCRKKSWATKKKDALFPYVN